MAKNIQLIIIDPQNSFCQVVDPAEQQRIHDGELCVTGAWDDMVRVANLINRIGDKIDDISVTLDSHDRLHIAHPLWFRSVSSNRMPDPFTIMREENGKIFGSTFGGVELGEFRTVRQGFMEQTIKYLKALKAGNRYPHVIWPFHCLIGTPGHNIVAPLAEALFDWENVNIARFQKITKGSNPSVEHFSAVRAEVVDPNDPSTSLNTNLIRSLMEADVILLAGEARSHCLANTVRDIADEFKADQDAFIRKCVLLSDATSDVPGCEALGETFVKEMVARGMQISTTKDYLA